MSHSESPPRQARASRTWHRRSFGIAHLAAALALAGCGGGAGAEEHAAAAATPRALIAGKPVQQARCVQWRTGTTAQRLAIVRVLGAVVGGPTGGARGTTLSESEAFRL